MSNIFVDWLKNYKKKSGIYEIHKILTPQTKRILIPGPENHGIDIVIHMDDAITGEETARTKDQTTKMR